MDPLSITASTITVINAARVVSATLHEFISTWRNSDSRVSALYTELSTLIGFLEAVVRTLKECRGESLSFASMDEDLWRQSALSLADCNTTLDELEALVNRIKSSGKHTGLFRKAKFTVDLTIYTRDIAGFQEKIHKSNWALQTMLAAINVSLSLRGNATQETTLYELRRLELSIKQSLQVALHQGDFFAHALGDPSDARVAHNLRNLAHAAQNFHSSASSTASTIHGANRSSSWNVQSDAAMSVGCQLTPDKREQIQRWATKRLRRMPSSAAVSVAPSTALPHPPDDIDSIVSDMEEENDDGDDEIEFELLFASGLEEVAKDSILNHDFAKAETFLEKAIQRHTGLTSGDSDFKRLQIQLAFCYFFQHKWRLAEPLITSIAKSKANQDMVICNLLHALSLAYLSEYRFEKAITVCKQALHGKRRLERALGESLASEYNETLSLLATIYDIQGDPMYAEIFRRTIPPEFSYRHPFNELEFISKHPTLFSTIFGEDAPPNWGEAPGKRLPVVAELPIATTPKGERINMGSFTSSRRTLQTKLELHEKLELDTAKEVAVSIPSSASASSGADDEASSASSFHARSPHSSSPEVAPKRSFSRKISQFFDTVRARPTVSPVEPQSPESEHPPSPLRQRRSMGFWSRSDSNIFDLPKAKTRLQKKASDESVKKASFTVLRGKRSSGFRILGIKPTHVNDWKTPSISTQLERRRQCRQSVYSWLGMSSEEHLEDDGPFGLGSSDNNPVTEPGVCASPSLPQEIGSLDRAELPDNAVNASKHPEALCGSTTAKDEVYSSNSISRPTEHNMPMPETRSPVRRPKLKISIPNSSKTPGRIRLVAHYPRLEPEYPVHGLQPTNTAQPSNPTLQFSTSAATGSGPRVLQNVDEEAGDGSSTKERKPPETVQGHTKGLQLDRTESEKSWVWAARVESEFQEPASVENSLRVEPKAPPGPKLSPSQVVAADRTEPCNAEGDTEPEPLTRSDSSRSWYPNDDRL